MFSLLHQALGNENHEDCFSWLLRACFAACLQKAQPSCVPLGNSAELCYLNVSDSLINTTIPRNFIDSSTEVAGDLHFPQSLSADAALPISICQTLDHSTSFC